jgi:hypothetical protein
MEVMVTASLGEQFEPRKAFTPDNSKRSFPKNSIFQQGANSQDAAFGTELARNPEQKPTTQWFSLDHIAHQEVVSEKADVSREGGVFARPILDLDRDVYGDELFHLAIPGNAGGPRNAWSS